MAADKAPNALGVEQKGQRTVKSMCGMCAVRCPIEVEVEDGRAIWIQGNPKDKTMGTSLCAKGAAGLAFEYDDQRPQQPMIRSGARGSGVWRRVSWDEALDYVAQGLKEVIAEHGAKGIAYSDRGGPFTDLAKSFVKALGTPNYFNHDCTCAINAHHAAKSLFGLGRGGLSYDIKNTKHIVLIGRNLLESLQVKEAKDFMDALDNGAKCTYIDVRATTTASKATRFWQIPPNTEYALNLAFIHQVIKERLYDAKFVDRWVTGLDELASFVQPYTPEWAEQQTGVPAGEIVAFVREVAADAPKVIFHGGWMVARHHQSFFTSRTSYLLNALFGAIETPGGLIIAKKPEDAGRKNLKSLGADIPKVSEPRVDGIGSQHKQWDPEAGLLHLLFEAMETGQPYPIGAYLVYRHDPLSAMPDPDAQIKALEKLKLLVAIDVNYSETAWRADVILPESTYLERGNILAAKNGAKPSFVIRDQCIAPRFDSRPAWWIFKELASRLGLGQYFPYETIEDIWRHQLDGTGVPLSDLRADGLVSLAGQPIMWDREDGLKFKTPSGKIELVSGVLQASGLPSLAPYQAPPELKPGQFRLIFGRPAVHSHAQSQNNQLLNELCPENSLWLHPESAAALGLKDGDMVEVSCQGSLAVGRLKLTSWINPQAAFMLHGFGHSVPWNTRSYNRGMADQRLMKGLLHSYDPVGGGNTLTESVITVKKAS